MSFKIVALILLLSSSIIHLMADWLNIRALKPEVHPQFKDVYDEEKYKKSQEYLKSKSHFSQFQSLLSLIMIVLFIGFNGFTLIDKTISNCTSSLWWQANLFIAMFIAATTLFQIPFALYDTFVIEEKFGFNKTKVGTFLTDTLKSFLLSILIGAPLYGGLILLLDKLGDTAWIVAWVTLFFVQLLFMFLAPALIMPLFNKFTPLENGALKERIEQYAKKVGFTFQGISVMDGSKRSSKANAFFTGFGRLRKIALYDTLIEKHTEEELEAVLAHEVGHFKKHHIWQMILFSFLSTGLLFYLMGVVQNSSSMYESFGLGGVTLYLLPILFSFFMIPLNFLLGIVQMILSRKNEFEADAYAKDTSSAEALIAGLKRLSVDSLSNLEPHPMKVFLEYSHPPVLARIKALRGEQ